MDLLHQVPLNTKDISQEFLNIDNKERSNPLAWNGQFSPQLVEILLKTYAEANTTVLDPFAGSGTLLHEAAICGLSAVGVDINPAACYLARLHTLANRKPPARANLVMQLDRVLPDLLGSDLPLFGKNDSADFRRECAVKVRKTLAGKSDVSEVLESLLILSDFLKEGHSSKDIALAWKKLRSIILNFPYSPRPLKVFNCDARCLPVESAAVGLVVTSPPYINVFNYHQNYRASTEAFGWDLLSVAKSEIGSNRKNRGNRFLTVTQYCLDIAQVFLELTRVCAKDCRIIFVVGRESQVLGVPFYNGMVISKLATRAVGCKLLTRQERVFKNRFGQSIYEDILHFTPPTNISASSFNESRRIAYDALKDGLRVADEDVKSDLEAAVEHVAEIEPSPIYDPRAARSTIGMPED